MCMREYLLVNKKGSVQETMTTWSIGKTSACESKISWQRVGQGPLLMKEGQLI